MISSPWASLEEVEVPNLWQLLSTVQPRRWNSLLKLWPQSRQLEKLINAIKTKERERELGARAVVESTSKGRGRGGGGRELRGVEQSTWTVLRLCQEVRQQLRDFIGEGESWPYFYVCLALWSTMTHDTHKLSLSLHRSLSLFLHVPLPPPPPPPIDRLPHTAAMLTQGSITSASSSSSSVNNSLSTYTNK